MRWAEQAVPAIVPAQWGWEMPPGVTRTVLPAGREARHGEGSGYTQSRRGNIKVNVDRNMDCQRALCSGNPYMPLLSKDAQFHSQKGH